MDSEYSSGDDDEVVISPLRLRSQVRNHKISRSTNNNNDRKLEDDAKDTEIESRCMESSEGLDQSVQDNSQEDFPYVTDCDQINEPSNGRNDSDTDGSEESDTEESFRQETSFVKVNENVNYDPELAFCNNSDLRKNNSFPFSGHSNERSWEEHLPPFDVFQDAVSHLGKRLLPPIKKVAKKKHRTLSESRLSLNGAIPDITLPTIEGSPAKTTSFEQSDKVKFQVGDGDLSDQEIFDTSTSSEHVESSSSSLDRRSQEDSNNLDESISESLQGKLLKVLKLEEFRCSSPTASIASAPIYPSKKRFSLVEDDDTESVASDTQLVRSHSDSGKRSCIVSNKVSPPEGLIIRRTSLEVEELLTEAKQEDSLMKSSLGNDLINYEEDEVSETLSTRSAGILPAIPSHGARERSFLVGNLTKHGSLLGSDELNRYFPDRRLKVFVGTWNMQKKGIPRNLNDFLLPKHEEYLQDMYVIGVQESTQDQKMWEVKLQETLGVNHVLAHSVSHGDLHMSLFVRRDLIWFCSPFEDDRVTTRMVSQIKTKGAVAIAFQFFGTSMIFITSHFHSGETRVKERIEDYIRIKEKIKLPKRLKYDSYKSSADDVTSRFDCTFWFGDLNFRVSLPHQIIHDEVNDPNNYDLKEVLKGDQLRAIMKRGRIFPEFHEAKIQFRPTYKFAAGSDRYDTSPKMRVPSYTDRILFKSKESSFVECTKYNSVPTLRKSDHRPVYGFFEVSLKPGRDSIHFGGGKFRTDVYEKAARMRAQRGNYQNNSTVCNIL